MAKGYWINLSEVTDPTGHAIYQKAVSEYLRRWGAKTLVVSTAKRHEVVEGSLPSRQLIQEFPDYETALAAYHSDEYREIRKLRKDTAVTNLVIVEGFE